MQRYGVGGSELPPALAKRRLPFNPNGRLPIDKPRFVPANDEELLASIFTWWNLLDGVMLKEEPGSRFMAGYIREVQLRRMMQLVRAPNVSTYCEVGMNGGHSAVAMLLANPQLKGHFFDLMRWNYSQPVARLLRSSFGERFSLREGYSYDTVPPWLDWARRNRTRCDVMLIDGGHNYATAYSDLQLFRHVAAPGARVVVDDINTEPGAALFKLEKQGALVVLEKYMFKKRTEHNPCQRKPAKRSFPCNAWGFAVAEYTPGPLSKVAAGSYVPGKGYPT